MSSSSSDLSVSVVVGSNGAAGSVEACLLALEAQRDGAEVIVAEPEPSPERVRERFPWARFETSPGALVPELWRDGIDRSSGEIVALTISPMQPAPDWLETVRARLGEDVVVAGAIEAGPGLRLVDWAEYFCRYARDMRPFPRHECAEIPGDNCAYRRELLDGTRDLYRAGFWEPEVNRALAAEGAKLWHDPTLVVRQGRSAGFTAFVRQRWVHGRAYGRQRGVRFSRGRRLAGVALAAAVPAILAFRTGREVFARQRCRWRFVFALPLLVVFDVAWAAGEARGYLDVLADR
jgi:hypothetical protein